MCRTGQGGLVGFGGRQNSYIFGIIPSSNR